MDEDLEAWWEEVDARRKAKYGGSSSEPMETVEQTENEYAKALKAGTAR